MAKTLRPKIDPDLMFFLPTCTKEQDAELERSIVKHGVLDTVKVWRQKGILVDGHRRLAALERIGQKNLKFKIECLDFEDIAEVKAFMAASQVGRRNLTKQQIDYYMGHEYLGSKQTAPFEKNGKIPSNSSDGDNHHPCATAAEKIAEKHGVGASQVLANAKFAKAVDAMPEEEKKAVLSGQSTKSKKDVIASAPAKCDKCIRLNLNLKDCPQCKIEKEKKGKKPDAKTKPGQAVFDWSAAESDFGRVMRIADSVAKAFPKEGNSPMVNELRERARAFGQQLAVCKKKLTHS